MSLDSTQAIVGAGGPTTVPPFDQVAVAVAPGGDLVVRLPGIVLIVAVDADSAAAPAPAPAPRLSGWGAGPAESPAVASAAAPAGDSRVGELVELCRRVSAAGSRAPGHRLYEELRTWLPTVSGLPSCAVAAATEAGLALVLVGTGVAEVPELGLRLTSADGEQSANGEPFLDRLVDWPPAPLRLSVGSPVDMAPHPLADLMAGSVPGGAAVLSTTPAAAPAAAGSIPGPTGLLRLPAPGAVLPPPPGGRHHRHDLGGGHEHAADHEQDGHELAGHEHGAGHGPEQVHPTGSAPDDGVQLGKGGGPAAPERPAPVEEPVELPAPARSASLLGEAAPEEPEREPLPVVSTEQPPAALAKQEPEDTRPKVDGYLCKNGHLNDPRVLFCALCGIRMAQQTGVFLEGIRPPLGLLVFDNGATVSLDAAYLLGREPDTDERVRAGELRPLLVVDQTGGVSRHHAEIRLEGWDAVLVDTGSANGTLVAAKGAPQWSSLVPNQPVRLAPGMAVRMGSRQFAFQSPHGGA